MVLAIFILTYLGVAVGRVPGLKVNRIGIALLGAIAMAVASGQDTAHSVGLINWPTVCLLFGFFVLAAQLRLSGFYDRVAAAIAARMSEPHRFLFYLLCLTAAMSAFLNHDIVCYVLAPVVGSALIRNKVDPVPYLVGLAAASNIGAAATLVGNAQDMLIAQVAHLDFLAYSLWAIVPVTIGLAATYFVIRYSADRRHPVFTQAEPEPQQPLNDFDAYHTAKGLVILFLVFGLFFTSLPKEWVVLVAAGVHLMSTKFRTEEILGLVDWPILVLFMSLFVVSGTFQEAGYGDNLVSTMVGWGFDPAKPANEALLTTGLSVLINNAPAVMLLVKLLAVTKPAVGYVMALSNSFAGNAILTASVANIVVVQQARRQGIVISFVEFFRLGMPITLISMAGVILWAILMAHFQAPALPVEP